MNAIEKLKYPTGKWKPQSTYTQEEIAGYLDKLDAFPKELLELLKRIPDSDYDNTYREGGWNIRQIVHHVLDSHMNSYMRFKLTLTENTPIIKPYEQDDWVNTPDAEDRNLIGIAELINVLHQRILKLLGGLDASDWTSKQYFHPERRVLVSLAENASLYAWHGHHHLAQIQIAAKS